MACRCLTVLYFPFSLSTPLRPSCCPCRLFLARCWPAFFLISRFFGLSITTNLFGMARTRAGLSGRPTCRPACRSGRLDHALPRPSISHGRQVPPFVLCSPAKGRPVLPSCLGCWFSWPWCRTGARFWPWWWCRPARLAALQQRVMAVGHPFIGRGSRPKVGGTPKGCPGRRPLTAFRFFAGGRVTHSVDRF